MNDSYAIILCCDTAQLTNKSFDTDSNVKTILSYPTNEIHNKDAKEIR